MYPLDLGAFTYAFAKGAMLFFRFPSRFYLLNHQRTLS